MTNAKNSRKIKWDITFPEWWKVWQDSGKWEQRGKGKGYCMTRIGDTGGYEVNNVEIKTISENFSDSYLKTTAKERFIKRKKFKLGTKTHCSNGHPRTKNNTSIINAKDGIKKICRLCFNERQRNRYKMLKLAKED
jgi:hypothetical protein